jgi:hypothetical protein
MLHNYHQLLWSVSDVESVKHISDYLQHEFDDVEDDEGNPQLIKESNFLYNIFHCNLALVLSVDLLQHLFLPQNINSRVIDVSPDVVMLNGVVVMM